MNLNLRIVTATLLPTLVIACIILFPLHTAIGASGLQYIDTNFENASPLTWEFDDQGRIHISMLYDHLRINQHRSDEYQDRVASHWHFRIEAPKGSQQTIIIDNLPRAATRMVNHTMISSDGVHWRALPMELRDENSMVGTVPMDETTMHVARIEPYDTTDLERFLADIRDNTLVDITTIGATVEGRSLEIVRIGNPSAPHRLLLRARCHPWESGGNWVVQGLMKRLLRGNAEAKKYLDRYCVYVLPMTNKDGVVRGRARYNSKGMDLNRQWDKPAVQTLAPENHALEGWLQRMAAAGTLPELAIDFHNASAGVIITSRKEKENASYIAHMRKYHALMKEQIPYTQKEKFVISQHTGGFSGGLVSRYNINACIHELSSKWLEDLQDYPSGKNWEQFGAHLCEVYYQYFDSK